MKTIFHKGILLFLMVGLLVLNSCTNNKKAKNTDVNEPPVETIIEDNLGNTFEESFNPPSPDEVMAFFESALISYNSSLMNNVERASNYFDSKSQALNLGIYLSDIAYMNLFANTSESMQYMETVFVLSEKLNISSAYDGDVISRLMANLSNQDSTMVITEQIYFSLIDYLIENQRSNVLALVSIGSYVEILHLAVSSVESYDPENAIIIQIADLNILLESIYLFAEQNTSDINVKNAFVHLQKIKEILDQTTANETTASLSTSNDNKVVISGGTQYEISENAFNQLKTEVERIRSFIVK